MPDKTTLTIQDVTLTVTNLDKVFYADGFTKGQVLDYYIRIAPLLLPHIKDRPVTLKRYPHGADAKFFYQKECPANRPDWFNTVPIWSDSRGKYINFCLLDSLPALVWVANLAALEFHPSLSRAVHPACPTAMVFDLDPGPPATLLECAEVGLLLRSALSSYGLDAFAKTSGSKGLQVYVPLNTPCSYDETKAFSHFLAKTLENYRPDLIVTKMRKDLRTGKVFIDWSQNDEHKTTVSVYSLRAKSRPTVSAPVSWSEVEAALANRDPALLDFDSAQVLERIRRYGDLFEPVLSLKQLLPKLYNKKAARKAANKHAYWSSSEEVSVPEQLSALDADH